MTHDRHTVIHYVEREGDAVTPLCRDWTHATNWTTVATITSCPECLARIAARAGAPPPPRDAKPTGRSR